MLNRFVLAAFVLCPTASFADTYQIYMPSTMPGMLGSAPPIMHIVNTDSRATVAVSTSAYIASYAESNWSFSSNDFVQVDGTSNNAGSSRERIFQDLKGIELTIRENGLVQVRDKGPDGIKVGDPGDTGDDGDNRAYDRILTLNTTNGSIISEVLVASNQSDYDHAVAAGHAAVLEPKTATSDELAGMELFKMTTYSENATNSGSLSGDAIQTQGSFSTSKITDADGKSLFRQEADGSIHIGENSVVIVDAPNSSSGYDMIYSSVADGATLQVGNSNTHRTIVQGSLQVTGPTTFDSQVNLGGNRISNLGSPLRANDAATRGYVDTALAGLPSKAYVDGVARGLGDGIEDSGALSAALTSLPNSAPGADAYCGGGLGSFGGSQAVALGCASDINERLSLNFGASFLAGSAARYGSKQFDDHSFKVGFVYKVGVKEAQPSAKSARLETEFTQQRANIMVLKAQQKIKDTKIAEYEERLTQLEAKLETLAVALNAGSHFVAFNQHD